MTKYKLSELSEKFIVGDWYDLTDIFYNGQNIDSLGQTGEYIITEVTPTTIEIMESKMKTTEPQIRTPLQNRSMHKYFSNLADDLNKNGFDQKTLLNAMDNAIEIPWTYTSLKPLIEMIGKTIYEDDNMNNFSIDHIHESIHILQHRINANYNNSILYDSDTNKILINDFVKHLNDSGYSKRVVLNQLPEHNLPQDMISIKELFKEMLPDLCGKSSTAELTTLELVNASRYFDNYIGSITGVSVSWPSLDSMSEEQREF